MYVKSGKSPNVTNIIGLLLGALTAISILSSGCQRASVEQISAVKQTHVSESDQPKVDLNLQSIEGTWFGSCIRDVQRSEFFRQDLIQISDEKIRFETSYFSDSSCQSLMFDEVFVGSFELKPEKINIKYASFGFTPHASIIVASLNIAGFCGLNDWEIKKEKSFPDVDGCGYSTGTELEIARYGSNELFLDGRKLMLNKKTTELDQ